MYYIKNNECDVSNLSVDDVTKGFCMLRNLKLKVVEIDVSDEKLQQSRKLRIDRSEI